MDKQAERRWRLVVAPVALAVGALGSAVTQVPPAAAHTGSDVVPVYNPIADGDNVHDDVSAWWPWGAEVAPARHHIVYSNWGYPNDWSIDVFARAAGRHVVNPFGSTTTSGHRVETTVVDVRPGCASGRAADGGYRVTVEAKDTVTGAVLARADLMHVDRPQVRAGQRLGAWTPIGFTARFTNNRCYQVTNDSGIHVHLEVINKHRYSCYYPKPYNAPLTELTRIGMAGTHHGGQRAQC